MKILIIIPPLISLPTKGQGGTERIAEGLINELVDRNHDVVLLGAGNCVTKAKYIPIFNNSIDQIPRNSAKEEASRSMRIEVAYLAELSHFLISHSREYDVIINHARAGYALLPVAQLINCPLLTVEHLPFFEEEVSLLEKYPNFYFVSVSISQQKNLQGRVKNIDVLYNGVDENQFKFSEQHEDYLLFVGAMGEHKAPHLAIEVAKKTGNRLILAGGKPREPYFSEKIAPQLDGDNIRYIGEIYGDEKVAYYQNAKALLFTSEIDESFGLVAIEAMSCGTPVVAIRNGAMEEIITDQVDGFVVDTVDQMVESVGKINQIERADCRKKVESMFTYKKMTDNYLESIEKIISKQKKTG